jgi:cell wall-associated NlpC family hydrolase
VAFGASALSVPKSRTTQDGQATGSSRSSQTGKTNDSGKQSQQARRPTPDFAASPYPLKIDSLTAAARHNPVVSLALKYLGVPYQWGGASPAMGFDCSGLVKYVFGKLGVSLPHYAASQWYSPNAVWVAPNRLQPGDLVFFVGSDGTRKSPGHVGIYVDDGYIIDAPHTGSFVRIDSLGEPRLADGYVGSKRIVSGSLHRHLLGSTKPAESTAFLPGFPSPLTIEPLAESLGATAASTAATPAGPWWAGVVLGGVILLLLAGGGVLHRRALRADPPS